MNPGHNKATGVFGAQRQTLGLASDDVLPWLTDPKIALASCPAHDITIRNWMLVGLPGQQTWASELAVVIGPRTLLAELEVEQGTDGRFIACVSAASRPLLVEAAATLQGAMLLAEQLATNALCKACNTFASGDPPD